MVNDRPKVSAGGHSEGRTQWKSKIVPTPDVAARSSPGKKSNGKELATAANTAHGKASQFLRTASADTWTATKTNSGCGLRKRLGSVVWRTVQKTNASLVEML